ncbi:hypothetical protein Dimus_019156 [Dionaea muscipula]
MLYSNDAGGGGGGGVGGGGGGGDFRTGGGGGGGGGNIEYLCSVFSGDSGGGVRDLRQQVWFDVWHSVQIRLVDDGGGGGTGTRFNRP